MPATFQRSPWLANFDQNPISMRTGSSTMTANTRFTRMGLDYENFDFNQSLNTSILPRNLKISTKNICSRWWRAFWKIRRIPINEREHQVAPLNWRSYVSKTQKPPKVEIEVKASRTDRALRYREKHARSLTYCSAFKAHRKVAT